MNATGFSPKIFLAAALLLAPLAAARAGDAASTIAFSDPSKPGTLRIRVWHGDVTVRGSDVKEVSVKADAEAAEPTPRKDGLRVLSTSSSYSLSEKGNVVTLDYGAEGWTEGSADFDITVPSSTTVVVASSVHGDFTCSGVSGDIDVRTTHGDVRLDDISGGALVETVKGDIRVKVRALAPSKPLSFTSMGGEVFIYVPADLKASVRFRTHRGVILTNFDDKVLVTKTEISTRPHKAPPVPATPGSTAAPVPPAPGADTVNASPSSGSDSDDDWRDQLRTSIRVAADEVAIAARDAAEAAREGIEQARFEVAGSLDKMPPLPPMTGGKTVSGILNGGGGEIQATTLNGDITLKKLE
jgi:hypothetical protein